MTGPDLVESEQTEARRLLAQSEDLGNGRAGIRRTAPVRRMLWRARHRFIRLRVLRRAFLSRTKP
ncbi:MAG: hypothetical protein QOK05_1395 [Chloroflexota bacterium]|jgi:hypothetical protein|nr:hypothetical protein [Chloroflexota bacterium]